ncbi:DNA polymerase V like protein [Zymoseptoria brevis]|uniref:DNA polymerase V like protein n=1 Tax=Zymoseptoria brevis TaxID=1047168 RepID=A0A0F4GGJ5_9PEZI|nr:DNA polymerase V like protein [Zymoseptoria brevis]
MSNLCDRTKSFNMPGTKRSFQADLDSANGPDGDAVHPSRKRKVSEADAELSEIFNGLRDELPTVRTEATLNLMRKLAVKTPDQTQKINNAITRLIKGVCSSSKGARLGFSLALSEVLRLARKGEAKLSVGQMVEKVEALTRPSERDGKVSGEEKRNYAIGRRFAFQAILQSGALSEKATTEEEARVVFDAVAELAAEKDWLRSECGLMLHEWLKAPGGEVKGDVLKALVEAWAAKGLVKTPEGVALWLTMRTSFEGFKLPKGHWHHNNPLSSQERAMLAKVLLKTADDSTEGVADGAVKKKSAGTRDSIPSFAWSVVLSHLYEQNNGKEFAQFWEDCVAKPMFSASSKPERKFLGLQIFTKALASAPAELLGKVTHANIIRCILDQRVKPDRYLFEAAKPPLNQMASRAKSDPAAGAEIVRQVLTVLPAGPLDKLTKATIDSMLAVAAPLEPLVQTFHDLCLRPGVSDSSEAEKKRRMLADFMLEMVRTRRNDESKKWLKPLLKHLTELAYAEIEGDVSPKLTEASRGVFREKLMLALGHLMDLPLEQAVTHTSIVVDKLHSARKSLVNELDKDASSAIKAARAQIASAEAKKSDDDSATKVILAFRLLLSLGILQVYKQEPESVSVLQDIITCYSSPQDDGDASTMLVELLLSFVSKQSSLFRKLAEQVFAAFAPDVTAEALQSMIDILSQKESLAGQQELFKQGDEEDEEEEEEDNDDEASDIEMEDVEDASDVEIVNGVVAGADKEDSDSDSDSGSDSDTSSPPSNEDEEAAFDRKLAAALGTAGTDNDAAASDSDGSDMDDEQMMALEPHLTTIFAERKKGSHTKQDNKDAKANIVNFKNRVLDLLGVYVKSQYGSPLVLDLLHPLVQLTRTTGSQPTAKKACDLLVTLFNACKEHKEYPEAPAMLSTSEDEDDENEEGEDDDDNGDDDDEDTVEASPLILILMAIHAEMMHGGSKVHATACSRTSQFLAKILIHQDSENWTRVNAMYGELQARWRVDVGSKVHGSVFNDWHSFSMQRGGV